MSRPRQVRCGKSRPGVDRIRSRRLSVCPDGPGVKRWASRRRCGRLRLARSTALRGGCQAWAIRRERMKFRQLAEYPRLPQLRKPRARPELDHQAGPAPVPGQAAKRPAAD